MYEYLELAWRVTVVTGIVLFAWSVSSSLETIARELTKLAKRDDA